MDGPNADGLGDLLQGSRGLLAASGGFTTRAGRDRS